MKKFILELFFSKKIRNREKHERCMNILRQCYMANYNMPHSPEYLDAIERHPDISDLDNTNWNR